VARMEAPEVIRALGLHPHPEGGHFDFAGFKLAPPGWMPGP